MEREEGFYWIKLESEEDWQPAQYAAEVWWVTGDDVYYEDNEVAVVGEQIIKK